MSYKPLPDGSPVARLLASRNTGHGMFISHLDKSPVILKVVTFLPSFIMYLALTCIMIWRAFYGKSHYMPVLAMLFDELVPTINAPSPTKWYWVIWDSAVDYLLYSKGWPLLRVFITGHFWMRLRWGFRPTEIVFRRPTGYRRLALNSLPREEFQTQFLNALYRAIDPKLVYGDTGYNTRSGFWVLEYELTGYAYAAMKRGEIPETRWDLSVWQCEEGKWNVWEVWRVHDNFLQEETVRIMKEKLLGMGKGGLVEKWQAHILATQLGENGAQQTTTVERIQATANLFKSEGVEIDPLYNEALDEAAELRSRESL